VRCVMIRISLALTLLAANVPFALAQHGGTPQEQNACSRDASRRRRMGSFVARFTLLQHYTDV